MIIIGILASIAIPVFLNQRAKARDTATKSDVETTGKEMATFYVDSSATALTVTGTIAAGTLTLAETTTSFSTPVRLSGGTAYVGAATNAVTYQTGTNCTKANGWVASLSNPSGSTKSYYFSAQGGLTSTAPVLTAACT
jgi:type IV pilus assembly protein PilA